jgi:hypothetical protein
VLAAGCGKGASSTVELDDPEASNPHGCADVFAPDLLPTFEVKISDADWGALQMEYADWMARQDQNLDLKPYHPTVFTYGSEVYEDAQIKLQANPSTSWVGNKMEFTIAFNKADKQKRFHGLRKIVLHASPPDKSLLRERLALSYLRLVGLPAQCENNARLNVNGRYYGLYENREALDDEFLDRVFPGLPHGDIWKNGYILDNGSTPLDPAGYNALMGLSKTDVAGFERMVDVDAALAEWAAEAMLPDSDAYWAVAHNFALYDHPTRGFLWLPYDKDATFDFAVFSADPITWVPSWSTGWGLHQQIAFSDPALVDRFVAKLADAEAAYDVDLLKSRLQRWAAQIADSVAADQVKPFSTDDQKLTVSNVNNYLSLRKQFVHSWLACYHGQGATDGDGDGYPWCRDCDDGNPAIHPGAAEICGNDVDENCNGRKDDCM